MAIPLIVAKKAGFAEKVQSSKAITIVMTVRYLSPLLFMSSKSTFFLSLQKTTMLVVTMMEATVVETMSAHNFALSAYAWIQKHSKFILNGVSKSTMLQKLSKCEVKA